MTAPLTIALLFALIITVCEPLFLSLAPEMAPQLISYTELPRKVSPIIPLVLNRSSSETLMKKVIGLFSPLVNYYIILEIRIKLPPSSIIISLNFSKFTSFVYEKFKYRKISVYARKNNFLFQFHFYVIRENL